MNQPNKQATTAVPILDCIAQRWSPYSFEPRGVEPEKLQACLEAARWAASSFNEQPWYFIVARREEDTEFKQALSCLMESNRLWAQNVGVLILTAFSTTFSMNGKPNRVAEHDLGLAVGNLCCQATALGLAVHQMAGVNLQAVRETYRVPAGIEPHTAIAIGYAASPDKAPSAQLADRDRAPRSRKPLEQFVFAGEWGRAETS